MMMPTIRYISFGLLIAGLLLGVIGAILGQFEIVLIAVVIPVIVAIGTYAIASVLLLFIGFVLTSTSHFLSQYNYDEEHGMEPPSTETSGIVSEKRGSGFILIGPVPVIWGTTDRLGWIMVLVVVLLAFGLLLAFLFRTF
jgi:uncharacterized protein (TIGR00304 family)